MSLIAQETQPLLSNPQRPTSNTDAQSANTPLAASSRRRDHSNESQVEAQAHPQDGHDQEKDERGTMRWSVDTVGLGCVLLGLVLFLPITQYIIFSNGGSKLGWFALHPTMQSLGITAAVLSIQSLQSTPSSATSRLAAFRRHQIIILVLAFPVFAIGVSAMVYNKASHGAKHFTTWHGKLGLVVVAWMIIQATIGILSHWMAQFNPSWKKLYKYHRLSGYILLPTVLTVAHLGGSYSDWVVGHSSLGLRIAAFDIGLALIGMGVVMRMRPSKMKFL